MTIITVDNILKAVLIERGTRQRIYTPKTQSIRRILRMTAQPHAWVYLPTCQPQVYKWAKAQL